MKITRKQLRKIIKEARLSFTTDPRPEDLYVIIGNAGRGRQNMYPSSLEPEVYSKEEADKIVKELGTKKLAYGGSVHYHSKPLGLAEEYIQPGQAAWTGLLGLLDQYGL